MTVNEVRRKLKKIDSLVHEWGMLDSLIKSSEKCRESGLEINEEMLVNARRRQTKISEEFDKYLV
jgi:hypothetical protein